MRTCKSRTIPIFVATPQLITFAFVYPWGLTRKNELNKGRFLWTYPLECRTFLRKLTAKYGKKQRICVWFCDHIGGLAKKSWQLCSTWIYMRYSPSLKGIRLNVLHIPTRYHYIENSSLHLAAISLVEFLCSFQTLEIPIGNVLLNYQLLKHQHSHLDSDGCIWHMIGFLDGEDADPGPGQWRSPKLQKNILYIYIYMCIHRIIIYDFI